MLPLYHCDFISCQHYIFYPFVGGWRLLTSLLRYFLHWSKLPSQIFFFSLPVIHRSFYCTSASCVVSCSWESKHVILICKSVFYPCTTVAFFPSFYYLLYLGGWIPVPYNLKLTNLLDDVLIFTMHYQTNSKNGVIIPIQGMDEKWLFVFLSPNFSIYIWKNWQPPPWSPISRINFKLDFWKSWIGLDDTILRLPVFPDITPFHFHSEFAKLYGTKRSI